MTTHRKPSRGAIYARISDDTEGRAAGVARQVEDSRALVEREGWTLGPWEPFIDNDISASTKSTKRRPSYDRLLELVESGEVDGIAFYSSSRLTRRPREFEDIIELVDRTKVVLASCTSGTADLSTADGRQLARMLAAVDAAEAERIGERVSRAFVQRRQEGKPSPASRSFGFEKGGMVVVPGEADIIREAAARVIEEGWSIGAVARDWNERGVPTVRGAKGWSRTTVSRTLTNPRVAGLVALRDEVVGVGSFEGIITREQREKIKAALDGKRAGTMPTYRERKHWLAGFLVCGRCTRPMKVNGLLAEDGGYRKDSYIVCSRTQFGCGGVKRNLAHVSEYVEQVLLARLEMSQPTGDGGLEEGAAAQAEVVQARITEIEEDIEDLEASFRQREIRFRDYNASLAVLRTQQEAAEGALRDLQTDRALPPDVDFLDLWRHGSVAERHEVMAWAIDHIVLYPIGRVGPVKAKALVATATHIEPRRRA